MDADLQAKIDANAKSQCDHSMARCPYGADAERREYAKQMSRRLAAYADREPDAEPEQEPAPEPTPDPVPAPTPEPEPEVATPPAPADDDAGEGTPDADGPRF